MTAEPLIQINRVSHSFGRIRAVRDVTLSVDAGEIHCLLGPSGSGKSTLLRLIAGLQRQDSGEIRIAGEIVSDASVHREAESRTVGFVFQDFALFPHLTVLRNVLFGMAARRSRMSRDHAMKLLDSVGLADRSSSMPHILSGGEQQRVALVRALAASPKVMLLDEPFSNLDAKRRAEVRDTTLSVLRQSDVATVMVTHDAAEAKLCSDRISLLERGEMIVSGPAGEVFAQPATSSLSASEEPINLIPAVQSGTGFTTQLGSAPLDTTLVDGQLLLRPEQLELLVDHAEEERGCPCSTETKTREGATTLYRVRVDGGLLVYVRCLWTMQPPDDAVLRVQIR